MPDQITTVVTPDDLPVGSVVMTETLDGFGSLERRVWMRHGGGDSGLLHDWQSTDGGFQRMGAAPHARDLWALNRRVIVLYRPDAVLVIPGQNPGKPTAEAVADALIQYETGGICHYGQTCGLCDCGKADETPEQTQTRDAMELDRARAVLALFPEQRCAPTEEEVARLIEPDAWALSDMEWHDDYGRTTAVTRSLEERGYIRRSANARARKITKLYADQPTVAQAKAEALRAAADELDRAAAEGRAARRVAGVRWGDRAPQSSMSYPTRAIATTCMPGASR